MGRGDARWSAAVAKCAAAFTGLAGRLLWARRHSCQRANSNFLRARASQRPAFLAAFISAAVAMPIGLGGATAQERPFNPIRKLTTSPTDRTLVDIEIVGSTSLVPEFHRLEPERVLRFRLERAYIYILLTKTQPGFESVSLRFDSKTALPMALFDFVALSGSFHQDIPGIPVLSHTEIVERAFVISLSSEMSALTLKRGSAGIARCRGAERSDGLFAYNWNGGANCFLPSYTRGSQYVAPYGDLSLQVTCQNSNFPSFDCELEFPFDRFGVRIAFNHIHLANWRAVIDRSADFLRSKQYP